MLLSLLLDLVHHLGLRVHHALDEPAAAAQLDHILQHEAHSAADLVGLALHDVLHLLEHGIELLANLDT